jgi:hypothetical protein
MHFVCQTQANHADEFRAQTGPMTGWKGFRQVVDGWDVALPSMEYPTRWHARPSPRPVSMAPPLCRDFALRPRSSWRLLGTDSANDFDEGF